MELKPKLITAGELRSVLNKLDKEEISFSYAAQMLSDIAEKKHLGLLDVRQCKAQDYAEFCVMCDRDGMPLVKYDDWLDLYYT